jgi:hypothetical protein
MLKDEEREEGRVKVIQLHSFSRDIVGDEGMQRAGDLHSSNWDMVEREGMQRACNCISSQGSGVWWSIRRELTLALEG